MIGRYVLHEALASGGMATVHLASLNIADPGFSRVVAAKVLHAHHSTNEDFRDMFLDEARLVSHIRHANVASTIDVLDADGELVLIMDYVDGPALSTLLRRVAQKGELVPIPIAVGILADVLEGLHAAHEVVSRDGHALGVVHRDVSPQNVLVGFDGVTRVVDFGVAKSLGKIQETAPGDVKGKASYMAPEQAMGQLIDRRVDVYAAAVVLWETLTASRLFGGETAAESMLKQLTMMPDPPSARRSEVSAALDAICMRGLAKSPPMRFATAREMAEALVAAQPPASQAEIARFVSSTCAELLVARKALLQRAADEVRTVTEVAKHDGRVSSLLPTPGHSLRPAGTPPRLVSTRPGPAEVTQPESRATRGRWLALALIGLVVVVGGVFAFRATRPRVEPAIEAPPRASVSASGGTADPIATGTASPPPTGVTPPAPTETVASAVSVVTTSKKPPAPPRPTHVSPPSAPSPSPPPAPSAAPPPKNCCAANGLRLRFDNCVDNCPK